MDEVGASFVEEFGTRMDEVRSILLGSSNFECEVEANGIWSRRHSEMISIEKFIDPILHLMHFKYTGIGQNNLTKTYVVPSGNILIHDAAHLSEQWRILKNIARGEMQIPELQIQVSQSKMMPIIVFPTLLAQHTMLAESMAFYIHRSYSNTTNPNWIGDIKIDLLSNNDINTFIKNYLFACFKLTERLLNNEAYINDDLYSSVLNNIHTQMLKEEEIAEKIISNELGNKFKRWYITYLNDIQKNHIDFVADIPQEEVTPYELDKLYKFERKYLEERVRNLRLQFQEG